MYVLKFDGLFQSLARHGGTGPSAGFMGYGWLLFQNERLVARGHGVFARAKHASSSVAEYLALIEGMEAMFDMGISSEPVEIIGDARALIEQMQGRSAVNSAQIRRLHRRASRLAHRFQDVRWTWTSRKHNRSADALTRRAMQQMTDDENSFQAAVRAIDHFGRKEPPGELLLPITDVRIYQAAY